LCPDKHVRDPRIDNKIGQRSKNRRNLLSTPGEYFKQLLLRAFVVSHVVKRRLGHLCHAMRRNLNMLYVIENSGVYGLTKGQFSASSDIGSKSKKG
jgi:hypothetical protein